MTEELKEYLIIPELCLDLPDDVRNKDRTAKNEWVRAQTRDKMIIISSQIRDIITEPVIFIHDGSGYGVKNHKSEDCSFILLTTNQAGIEEIKKIHGIVAAYENLPDVIELENEADTGARKIDPNLHPI